MTTIARPRRDHAFDLNRIRQALALRRAGVMHRLTVIQDDRRGPQRIVRRRDQHLVTRIQQATQRKVDQFADAIADEHVVDVHAFDAARLHDLNDGLARLGQALLMTVGLAIAQMAGDRLAHMLGSLETKAARIADIKADDRFTLLLKVERAGMQRPADVVTDIGQTLVVRDRAKHDSEIFVRRAVSVPRKA